MDGSASGGTHLVGYKWRGGRMPTFRPDNPSGRRPFRPNRPPRPPPNPRPNSLPMREASLVDQARDLVRAAGRVLVLTGAGVSAESGVPTFRGPGGLWRNYRPEELATPQAFARDPQLVWEWYDWRRTRIGACEPNPAHHVIAEWSRRNGFTLITQNVYGLHERAATRNAVNGSRAEFAKRHGDKPGSSAFRRGRPA